MRKTLSDLSLEALREMLRATIADAGPELQSVQILRRVIARKETAAREFYGESPSRTEASLHD